VDGGFAQVRADVVTVLTPRAQKAETIDAAAAAAALEAAHAVATTPPAQAAQQKAQDRARAQLRLAAKVTDGGAHGGH
jgi:F-type H+-transporting ATPase subunit epsilon